MAQLALLEQSGSLLGNVLASDLDLNLDAPGLSLALGRANLMPLAGRYRLGPLGYGWMHNWEIAADEDADGNVAIEQGGGVRFFTRQLDGNYLGAPGDAAVLARAGGVLRLRETDGTVLSFRTDGRLDFVEDPNLNRITPSYDAAGRLTRLLHSSGPEFSFDYDAATGRLILVSDSVGRSAVYSYDASGTHLLSVATPGGTMHYDYHPRSDPATLHALTKITERDGTHVFYSYDAQGRLNGAERDGGTERITITYGAFGEVTLTPAASSETTVFFNDSAQPELVRDALGRTTAYDFDGNRFLSRMTAADGAAWLFKYNAAGSLLQTTSPLGNSLSLAYEPLFQQLSQFQDAGGKSMSFAVDSRGNTSTARYAEGTTEQFQYDARGNLTRSISRNGDIIDYTYDSRGLLTSVDAPGVGASLYTYDARGNLLSATDARGTIALQYDTAGRLARVDYPGGRFVAYEYDAGGRRTRINQNGFVVNYTYDAGGRLSAVKDAGGGLIAMYTYDSRGDMVRKDLGHGNYTTYEYDAAGQLLHLLNHRLDNSINSRFDYAYDDLGQITSVVTLDGTTTYTYDLEGQLTSASLPGGRTIQYLYDASGNRVQVIDTGVATAYTSNNLNQYTRVGAATYTYDANGNLKTRTDADGTTTYTFNALNQLISIAGPGGTYTYEYDALGNRVAEITNGQRQELLIDPTGSGNLVAAYDAGGSLLAAYAYGLGLGLVAQFAGGSPYFFDFDVTGSTTGLTNSAGIYVNRYAYLPFGETTVLTETIANPFRFVGEYGVLDRGHGLLDMRARHYDPRVGQFVSDDPVGLAGKDANLRRYAANNPVSIIDPNGLAGYLAIRRFDGGAINPLDLGMWDVNVCIGHSEFLFSDGSHIGYTRPGGTPLFGAPGGFAPGADGGYYAIWKFDDEARLKRAIDAVDRNSDHIYNLIPFLGDNCHSAAKKVIVAYYLLGIGDPLLNWAKKQALAIPGVAASDPNDIVGPLGFGPPQFTTPSHLYHYTIRFQNDPLIATAPAQEVFVTQQLDPDLDWTTFELGDIGFGDLTITVPPGLKEYQTQVAYQNVDGSPLLVDFHGRLDLATGLAAWTFRSVDPASGGLPDGVFDGFLPVDDATGRGSGFIHYLVRPRAGLPTAATIDAAASIVFDINPPLATNMFTNTIDSGPPAASINALPAVSNRIIPVSWRGADDPGGSGIARYSVLVSDNGGPFAPWLTDTSTTAAPFVGLAGHTYTFRVVAVDHVGLSSTPASAQDVQTRVHTVIWQNALDPLDVNLDTHISPLDALLVINVLNADQGGPVPPDAAAAAPPYLDTSGDHHVSPLDALLVFNYLNAVPSGLQGEAETSSPGRAGNALAPEGGDALQLDAALPRLRNQQASGQGVASWALRDISSAGHRDHAPDPAPVGALPAYALGAPRRRADLPSEPPAHPRNFLDSFATDLVLEHWESARDEEHATGSDVAAWLELLPKTRQTR